MKHVLTVVVVVLASAGVRAEEPNTAIDVDFKAQIDGSVQKYVEIVPKGWTAGKSCDVLIVLHGHGSDRWQYVKSDRGECKAARDFAAKHGMILISPDYRATTSWMGPKAEADLVQIIGDLRMKHQVGNVYLAGGSMGGTSALILAALHPDLIAGVSSQNGTANMLEYKAFQEAIIVSYGGDKEKLREEYVKRSPEFVPEKFSMPVACTVGGKDKIVPPDSVRRLVKAMQGLKKKDVLLIDREDGGHATNHEDTTKALEFILASAKRPGPDAKAKNEPVKLKLWDGNAPVGEGKFEKGDALITVHKPEKPNGTAVVICPGGGYGGLVTGAEGHGIAMWLNRHGVTGIVLEYRLPKGRPFVPLLDAQRAIRTVRSHCKEWSLDPAKVGIIGFSAGGHLASTAGTHFDDGDPKADDPIDRLGSRPDFMILVYPVVSMGEKGHGGSRNNLLGSKPDAKLVELFSNEKHVTAKTPPAFLAHAKDDRAVVSENSKLLYDALREQKVKAKYLELPSGGHGLNGYKGPMWDAWQEQSLAWLGELKFLTAK